MLMPHVAAYSCPHSGHIGFLFFASICCSLTLLLFFTHECLIPGELVMLVEYSAICDRIIPRTRYSGFRVQKECNGRQLRCIVCCISIVIQIDWSMLAILWNVIVYTIHYTSIFSNVLIHYTVIHYIQSFEDSWILYINVYSSLLSPAALYAYT